MQKLDRFRTLAHVRNPFRSAIVTDPWKGTQVDVQEIHSTAFNLCREAIDHVRNQHESASILIDGEPGSGKTHLLARLRADLGPPEHEHQVVFISIQLQASPKTIWRHVRRRVADDLLRGRNGAPSQFKALLARCFIETDTGQLAAFGIDGDTDVVLGHLAGDHHRREARAWLRGDSLSDSTLERLGLPRTDPEEDMEDKARRVVQGLCLLAGHYGIPLVFCFDQIEALKGSHGDITGLKEFGRTVRTLYKTDNVMIVSCIQTSFINDLVGSVDEADRDRLRSFGQEVLRGLNCDQAFALLEARLDSVPELQALRDQRGRTERAWPLHQKDIRQFFASQHELGHAPEIVARTILVRCADLFEGTRSDWLGQVRPPPVKKESHQAFLDRTWAEREEEAVKGNTPNDTDQILQHGLPLLAEVGEGDHKPETDTAARDIDMVFTEPAGSRVEVSLCNDRSMNKLVWRLKRLCREVAQGRFQKLVLVRDVRSAIPGTAVKTREYLTNLQKHGVMLVRPSVGALAALDTMRKLLSDAKAGDLANREHTVEPTTVEEWLRANLPGSLGDLLQQVLSPNAADAPPDGLLDLVRERRVARLDEVANELDHPSASVEAWIRKNGELVGILNGPPRVVFQVVPDSIAAEGPEGN